MIDGLKPYPVMKDSGVPWLGAVPAHWEIRRLRNLAAVQFSGVDRVTSADEHVVTFVGTDIVYSRREIVPASVQSTATASRNEIARFSLRKNDIVLTKDSVVPTRIAVPAIVVDDPAVPTVCGYHLALVRPTQALAARFLLWVLQGPQWAGHFVSMSRGTTIVGLPFQAVASAPIVYPALIEQHGIVAFLDHAVGRIQRHIRAKKRLIALLEEQRHAIVHRSVMHGLDPNVPLKASGVSWLGDVPAHWEVRAAKWFYREVDEPSIRGQEELLSVSHLTGVTPRSQKNITMFMASSYEGHKLCRRGDVVINTMWAWAGALGVAREAGIVSPAYGVYRPTSGSTLTMDFADLLLRSQAYIGEYNRRSTGIQASRLRLYPAQFLSMHVACPPVPEQEAITASVRAQTAALDRSIDTYRRQIGLMHEYRIRLIADVVTGKLDVRDAAARLPEEIDEPEPIDDRPGEDANRAITEDDEGVLEALA